MPTRTTLLAAMIACLLCGIVGRSVADGKLPQAVITAQKPVAPIPTATAEVSRPTAPAFYKFTGPPVIRAWSSVPRRT